MDTSHVSRETLNYADGPRNLKYIALTHHPVCKQLYIIINMIVVCPCVMGGRFDTGGYISSCRAQEATNGLQTLYIQLPGKLVQQLGNNGHLHVAPCNQAKCSNRMKQMCMRRRHNPGLFTAPFYHSMTVNGYSVCIGVHTSDSILIQPQKNALLM